MRLTLEEYHRLVEVGIIGKVELIEGRLMIGRFEIGLTDEQHDGQAVGCARVRRSGRRLAARAADGREDPRPPTFAFARGKSDLPSASAFDDYGGWSAVKRKAQELNAEKIPF